MPFLSPFMVEDTELVNGPTARNDQSWNLNPQGLTPEPITTTLYNVTSPKEMWEGLPPGSPQVAPSGDMSSRQGQTPVRRDCLFYVSPETASPPPTQGPYHAGEGRGPLNSATLSPGRGMLCKASDMVLVWGGWGRNHCRLSVRAGEKFPAQPGVLRTWVERRKRHVRLALQPNLQYALHPSIHGWNWITNHEAEGYIHNVLLDKLRQAGKSIVCVRSAPELGPRLLLAHCWSPYSNQWTLLSPQPCSARFELALHISVNRISKSSRGKVKNISLFSNWLMKISSSNWTFPSCLCLLMPVFNCL